MFYIKTKEQLYDTKSFINNSLFDTRLQLRDI